MSDHASPNRSSEVARLLSLTSHELRTPISVVAGYLRMLQKDRDQFDERHRKMIDEAEKACGRMVALIGEISNVGKLEGAETPLRKESCDVTALLKEVASAAAPADNRVQVAYRGDEQSTLVQADKAQIRTSFENLVRAVVREQIEEVVIALTLERLDTSTARIIIARDGEAGQLALKPAAAFDEYRGGIGLVLPIARRVIELHGGRIWSPANDQGVAAPRSGILIELPLF